MPSNIRKSLLSMHILLRLLCIQSFDFYQLSPSICGIAFCCCGAIAYIFLQRANPPPASILNNINLLATIIDYYNRYAMFIGVLVIVCSSIYGQRKIIQALRHLEQADEHLHRNFGIIVDNYGRCR